MKNKYQQILLDKANRLEKIIGKEWKILIHTKGAIDNNHKSIRELYTIISSIAKIEDKDLLLIIRDFNDSLLTFFGYQKIKESFAQFNDDDKTSDEKEYTLEELLLKLKELVGLEKVKNKVYDLISYQKVQKLRKDNGLPISKNTLHLAFTGNPGTGKTTVARIIGHIYKQLGLLSKGHFIEVSRTDLIAGYQGQTALKVKNVIEKAKGGVLFIDEAYSITENEHSDSYGRECLTELTKALEDYREDLVVIVAGYTEPMQKFFNSNMGLKSRFNTFIEFDDYNEEELLEMIINLFQKNDYELDSQMIDKIKILLAKQSNNSNVSNGRFVRNIYEDIVMEHSKRVSQIITPTIEDLKMLKEEDIDNYILSRNPIEPL